MTAGLFLVLASFLASAVEAVEALTIVLATGVTRGWRSALLGVMAALVVLAIIVAIFGPRVADIPIDALRTVVGAILLIFGLQWLRKAILRYSGLKALHDEQGIFEREVAQLKDTGVTGGAMDWPGFVVSFKGVFLEGLEVVFIVITFGAEAQNTMLAAIGAAGACLLVAVVGLAVHRPLTRVPENTMKFCVGVMLCSFGTFWAGEGAGMAWPGADVAILGLIVAYALVSWLVIGALRRQMAGAPVPAH